MHASPLTLGLNHSSPHSVELEVSARGRCHTQSRETRSWMISLCKYNGNASVRNHLQKEDSGHCSQTKSTVDSAQACGGASLAAAAAAVLLGGLGSLLTGVDELALAEELALDPVLLLQRLVESAGLGDVASRLQVESTLDALKLRSFDACTLLARTRKITLKLSTHLLMFPEISKAPPMLLSRGNPSMMERLVLLAICRLSVILVNRGKLMLETCSLPTMARASPTVVRLGAEKLSKPLVYRPRDPLVVSREGSEREPTERKVRLVAQMRLGRVMTRSLLLLAKVSESETLPSCMLTSLIWALLAMKMVSTCSMLIPDRKSTRLNS